MKKHLFFTALAAMLFTGCHKQSELDENAMAGSCTIKGTVEYVNGDDGNITPKSNVQVVLGIPYSEYDGNASDDAYKQIYTTTDSEGKYSFTVPVGLLTMTGYVKVVDFEDEYTYYDIEYETDEYGDYILDEDHNRVIKKKTVTEKVPAVYQSYAISIDIYNKGIQLADIVAVSRHASVPMK